MKAFSTKREGAAAERTTRARATVMSVLTITCCVALHPAMATPPAVVDLAPPTQVELDAFRDSVRAGQPFSPVQVEKSDEVDVNLAGVWAGSKTAIESDTGEIVLRYAPKVEALVELSKTVDNPASSLLPSFDLRFSLFKNRFEIHHSEGVGQSSKGLLVLLNRSEESHTVVIEGQRGSGGYITIPQFSDPEVGWGFLMCPRTIENVRRERYSTPRLKPSVYELTEAKVSFAGNASIAFATAGQEGRARVSMAVSKNLPPPTIASDRAISSLPKVDLRYSSHNTAQFFPLRGTPAIQEGLRILVELQKSAGYIRRQYFLHSVSISTANEPALTHVVVNKSKVESDEGECQIVIVRRHQWTTYGKEDPIF